VGVVVSKKSNSGKIFENTALMCAIVVTLIFLSMSGKLYDLYMEKAYPKSEIYGAWVEQDVASYAADIFMLNKSGVIIKGKIVTTKYDWDGASLKYHLGDKIRRFKVKKNEPDFMEIQLISEPHYKPIFRLAK
jgi:hypothetical protein|tara:strand:+ start:68 stop:466 length:399 start_codon:yes stop_codon:yes gene_type:complete